jgi:hypothetical protein
MVRCMQYDANPIRSYDWLHLVDTRGDHQAEDAVYYTVFLNRKVAIQ